MTAKEFQRLIAFDRSGKLGRTHRARNSASKRSVKNRGRGVGSVLKNSRVVSGVNIERVFIVRK